MGAMKEIDRLQKEIGSVLGVNPDRVNFFKADDGWKAYVLTFDGIESQVKPTPIEAMQDLLEKAEIRHPYLFFLTPD